MAVQAVHLVRGHPKTGTVLISLASAGVLGKVMLYLWRRHLANRKRQNRQDEAEARTAEVAKTLTEVTFEKKFSNSFIILISLLYRLVSVVGKL